jgi:2-hydroxychromene-2-carboxylate isomerase
MAAFDQVEVFFDCGSPWSYLGFHNVQILAAQTGCRLAWRPILVGGVFNAVNRSVYESRAAPVPAKARYMLKDIRDHADAAGLRIVMPPAIFPMNTVRAMRACVAALPSGLMPPLARQLFEAYWGREEDIARDEVIAQCARRAGLDPSDILEAAGGAAAKQTLRANTDDLIARGGFGSPTFFLNHADMYFGNDRLALLARRIAAGAGAGG